MHCTPQLQQKLAENAFWSVTFHRLHNLLRRLEHGIACEKRDSRLAKFAADDREP